MNESENLPKNLPFKTDAFAAACAVIMLRIWLGLRCLQAGIEKYAGTVYISTPTIVNDIPDPNGMETTIELKKYSLENYSGIPASLAEKFKHEPLVGDFFLSIYQDWLGPALIVIGLCVLIGLATRISLLAMGLIYTSLTYGLVLLNQAPGIAWLGIHIILIALALLLAAYNRFELGNALANRDGLKWLRNK